MHSAKSIFDPARAFFLPLFLLINTGAAWSQLNSPYSRYGLGDLLSSQNAVNRGMGGFAAAYSDYGLVGSPFHINFTNPASLGNLSQTKNFSNTIFDMGSEVMIQTLKSTTTADKFRSTGAIINYLQVGFPISTPRMEKKGRSWGLSFGLRPVTRISYKVEERGRLSNIDSINTLYEGNGGLNQVNVSTGYRIIGNGKYKNEFSFGISTGYLFGNKSNSTRTSLVNDTVSYYKSNNELKARYGGVFLHGGIQYRMTVGKSATLRLGAYAHLQQNLSAVESTINETFGFDASGGLIRIDSVSFREEVSGSIALPATYGAGFAYQSGNRHWLFGADVELTGWSAYRYFGQPDLLRDIWTVRGGVEYYPASASQAGSKYFQYVKYRAGAYFGPDYISLTPSARNLYAFTAGATLPLTTPRFIQSRGEYVSLTTTCEIGARGDRESAGLRENFVRLNIGLSMNARWFQKRSYD